MKEDIITVWMVIFCLFFSAAICVLKCMGCYFFFCFWLYIKMFVYRSLIKKCYFKLLNGLTRMALYKSCKLFAYKSNISVFIICNFFLTCKFVTYYFFQFLSSVQAAKNILHPIYWSITLEWWQPNFIILPCFKG